ncbi:hypothetical protein [Desulfocicer niacini]
MESHELRKLSSPVGKADIDTQVQLRFRKIEVYFDFRFLSLIFVLFWQGNQQNLFGSGLSRLGLTSKKIFAALCSLPQNNVAHKRGLNEVAGTAGNRQSGLLIEDGMSVTNCF